MFLLIIIRKQNLISHASISVQTQTDSRYLVYYYFIKFMGSSVFTLNNHSNLPTLLTQYLNFSFIFSYFKIYNIDLCHLKTTALNTIKISIRNISNDLLFNYNFNIWSFEPDYWIGKTRKSSDIALTDTCIRYRMYRIVACLFIAIR